MSRYNLPWVFPKLVHDTVPAEFWNFLVRFGLRQGSHYFILLKLCFPSSCSIPYPGYEEEIFPSPPTHLLILGTPMVHRVLHFNTRFNTAINLKETAVLKKISVWANKPFDGGFFHIKDIKFLCSSAELYTYIYLTYTTCTSELSCVY